MAAKCEIQFPDSDQTMEAELDFDVSSQARSPVIYNYQIGYREHSWGDKVYHEKGSTPLRFSKRKTG
jgi:hypothetical protein